LLAGIGLHALGVALILATPLHPAAKMLGSSGYLLLSLWEFLRLSRGFARCCRLRVTEGGGLSLLDPDGNWQAARLLPGSVVLRKVAWIRCKTEQGHHCAELIRGNCRESKDWRRLHVIWRHIGGTR
jgi:hypothetical protein